MICEKTKRSRIPHILQVMLSNRQLHKRPKSIQLLNIYFKQWDLKGIIDFNQSLLIYQNQNQMPIEEDYDFLFKTVIVGDTNVGKTQILSRFIQNQFAQDSKPTVGVQFGTKTIKIGQVSVKNQIWDTAGQQRFRALTCAYYRGAVGAIIVFDLSKNITFEHVSRWIKEVKEYSEPGVSILLVGNKNDIIGHEVRQEDIQNFAADNKLLYLSTSAATGQNIQLAFDTLVKQILGYFDPTANIDFQNTQNQSTSDQKQNNHPQRYKKKNTNPSSHQIEDNPTQPKRQKPKIQAFSIDEVSKKTKINKNKHQKQKKNCC